LLGITDIDTPGFSSLFHRLDFEGRYNLSLLINEYRKLPNVAWVEPAYLTVGDSSDVCLSIENDIHYYIFDFGSGDCPAGCTNHTYCGYSIDYSGQITELGTYETGATKPPLWFENLSNCKKWL